MRLGLMGLSDKRHVVYSLIRVLGNLGRTIFLTQNQQYLMLSPDHLNEFEISDVHVLVYEGDVDDLEDGYELHSYEYVIYDIWKQMPQSLDCGMIFDSREFYIYDLEDRNLDSITVFSVDGTKKDEQLPHEKAIKIPPASLIEPTLQTMFNTQTLTPIKNSTFITSMTHVIKEVTGLSSGQISSRLKKGDLKV